MMENTSNTAADDILLQELNHNEARKYVGGVVFVSLIMVIGIVGNLHVLIVYTFRMKPSNHRIFILMLAVLDFITCSVGMPFILFDLRNPWTFTMTAACKILRFINYFICSSSALLLVVIAVDRYRKICVPLGKQMTTNVAKLMCCVVLVVSCLLTWPAPVLYGDDTVAIQGYNITGTRCYIVDKFKPTKYMAYFNVMLILTVLIVVSVLVVLYVLIWRVIRKHNVIHGKSVHAGVTNEQSSTTSMSTELTSTSSSGATGPTNDVRCEIQPLSETKRKEQAKAVKSISNAVQRGNHFDKKRFDRAKKTTLMFLLITVVFIVSYFPHLALKIVTFLNKDFVPNLTFTGTVMYNTFVWCFFINNMANAFIYGFCDTRFMTEVKSLYRKTFHCIF